MQEGLAILDELAFTSNRRVATLAAMTIHSKIKTLRLALKWSQTELARRVSEAEGLEKPLNWQTVQQWEKNTRPQSHRLATVAKVLGTNPSALLGETDGAQMVEELRGWEGHLVMLFRGMNSTEQAALIDDIEQRRAGKPRVFLSGAAEQASTAEAPVKMPTPPRKRRAIGPTAPHRPTRL